MERKPKRNRKGMQVQENRKLQFLIDIQAKIQEGKGGGYTRWASVFNLKQMAQAMMFLKEHEIESYEDLAQKTAAYTERRDSLLESVKADETRLQEIAVLKMHIVNYAKSRDVFAAYQSSGYSQEYFEEHRDVLPDERQQSRLLMPIRKHMEGYKDSPHQGTEPSMPRWSEKNRITRSTGNARQSCRTIWWQNLIVRELLKEEAVYDEKQTREDRDQEKNR
ncbi:MAG: hypothetical protein ACLS8T_31760 [Anaerobutyricum sp.]